MGKISLLTLAALVVALYPQTGLAQFRIDSPQLPGLPRVERPRRDQPKPEQPTSSGSRVNETPAANIPSVPAVISGNDQPTVAKDSVQVTAFTFNVFRGNYDAWSWVPRLEFRVNGPIESGGQLYAEFVIPGTGSWVKFDCRTEVTQKGNRWRTECGARDIPEERVRPTPASLTSRSR